jgi:hypothetical protein
MRSLAASWQISPMAKPTIRTQIHEPFHMEPNLTPQIALDLIALVKNRTDPRNFSIGQMIRLLRGINLRFLQDLSRGSTAHTEDRRQCNFDTLVSWQVDACNSCHD